MYYIKTETERDITVEQVFTRRDDGSIVSFPNVESNEGPDRAAYLAWVAEGNTPEPWPPAE